MAKTIALSDVADGQMFVLHNTDSQGVSVCKIKTGGRADGAMYDRYAAYMDEADGATDDMPHVYAGQADGDAAKISL